MSSHPASQGRLRLVFLSAILVILATVSCARRGDNPEEIQVKRAFDTCQTAILEGHADRAMACIPRNADDYFQALNSGAENSAPALAANPVTANLPAINQLVRTALAQKVPAALRSHMTLETLVQLMFDRHLLDPDGVRDLKIGRITIQGDHADAELFYQGVLTPLPLSFIEVDGQWKIDLLALLPYTELFMRVDRTLRGETQDEQIEQLVNPLPVL